MADPDTPLPPEGASPSLETEGLRRLLDVSRRINAEVNPDAVLIVGDVYGPQGTLSDVDRQGLDTANAIIRVNCDKVGARLAPIHGTFRGHEAMYLCQGIEPTYRGAEAIAGLFRLGWESRQTDRLQ